MPHARLIPLAIVILSMSVLENTALAQPGFQPPAIESCVSIREGKSGSSVALDQMLSELAAADVVFLGEFHNDDTTHRFQLAVLESLLEQRDGKVVLAMEMFERDVQSVLDQYLAGEIDEKTFLSSARPWQNYVEAYRPLVESAKKAKAPVIASNFPRPLRMKMMSDPEKGLSELGDNKDWAPAEFFPNSDLYWKRTDNAIRGHLGMMPASESTNRLYSTQSLWDNAMGDSCAKAIDQYPDHVVLHVNGGFHSQYWDGTVHQLRQRKPDAQVRTVAIRPAAHPSSHQLQGAPVADYVALVEERAGNLNDGKWSVTIPRRQTYQLHVPEGASVDQPIPLLIWLVEDGLSARDGLEYWKSILGDKAAIVAIEPTHRQRQRDLSLGGQWFWLDQFSEDMSAMVGTIEEVWSYVLSRYPIDPKRVCLAGEGTGATVVAAATLLTDRLRVQSVAIGPKQFSKLKDFPLPLLEDWGDQAPPQRHLLVLGASADRQWWADELKQYGSVGLPAEFAESPDDPWKAQADSSMGVVTAMGLDWHHPGSETEKAYLLVESGEPLEWAWARFAAQRASNDEEHCVAVKSVPEDPAARPVSVEISPQSVLESDVLPRCPGPFGGTTVLVVPAASEEWLEVEANDPINKSSRFHRLRIATFESGERNVLRVLQELVQQNRKNVLIVPAMFYAGEERMRELERQIAGRVDQATIHWLPGLGGQLFPVRTD